ncbi:MAG: hypothetical protein V2G43_01130 [bacterium JZ-2024 1]
MVHWLGEDEDDRLREGNPGGAVLREGRGKEGRISIAYEKGSSGAGGEKSESESEGKDGA